MITAITIPNVINVGARLPRKIPLRITNMKSPKNTNPVAYKAILTIFTNTFRLAPFP
jgi:hypothetical protein